MAKQKSTERVEVFIPRGAKNDDPNLFVSVNGKSYLLPRGKSSLVPLEVATELKRAEIAQQKLDETVEQLLQEAAKPLG